MPLLGPLTAVPLAVSAVLALQPTWPVPELYPKWAPPAGAERVIDWGRPVLSDDFDSDHVNPGKWAVYDDPTGSNPRTARATTVSDGALHLTGALYGGRDLSGGLATHLAQTFGRWEARMKADPGAGYSAVMLLWPTRQGAPEWAEINFAEIPDPRRRVAGLFIHKGRNDTTRSRMLRGTFTRWHTYTLEWLPRSITFSLDGRKVWTYKGKNIPQRADMHLALQNDVSCYSRTQCRNPATPTRVTMHVDWVRIYRLPPSFQRG
ncbi:glycoside hydrolase family 16 protein [Actinocorallia longicatena]